MILLNKTAKISWHMAIQRYVLLLLLLVIILGIAIIGYISWYKDSSEKILFLANNYHLASMLHCADAREEIRHVQFHAGFELAGIKEEQILMGHKYEFNESIAIHIILRDIDKVIELQRNFAEQKFALLINRLEQRVELFVDAKDSRQKAHNLASVLMILKQLGRLHLIAYQDIRSAQKSQAPVLFLSVFIIVVVLSGFLLMRKGLQAITNITDKQRNTELA
jgi:hypothetical protein